MRAVGRTLLMVAAFSGAAVAMYFIRPSLGIEPGTWQSAILFGVIVAIASFVWRATAPKDRRPPQSN
jgi:hypothetical protein